MPSTHRPGAMSCAELVALVTDYLEDALLYEDRHRFEEHAAGCESCEAHIEQMRTTIGLLGMLTPDVIPDRVRDDLLAAFRDWKRGAA